MQQSRRSFIRQSSLALAAAALPAKSIFKFDELRNYLGIQLYSVRDDMKTDPAGTLQRLANIGYRYVEHANYENGKFYGYAATEFKKMLDDIGLKMHSGHTGLKIKHWNASKKDFTDDWKQTIEDAASVGQHYVISPSLDEDIRKSKDKILAFMDIFNKCGSLCKTYNMKFGYHNHDFEFKEKFSDKLLYEIILDNTNPELVAQQIDTGNMYGAGGRSIEIIKKYPNRFSLMHVKDETPVTEGAGEMGYGYESTILGKGVVGIKDIIDIANETAGTKYYIVEQGSYQGMHPIDCAEKNYSVMKGWGFK